MCGWLHCGGRGGGERGVQAVPGEAMLRAGLKCHSWLAKPTCMVRPRLLTPKAFPGRCKRLRMRNHLYKSAYVQSGQGYLMACAGETSVCEPWVQE